jgi:hypothetical protein
MTTSQIRCLLAIVSLAEANEAATSKNAASLLGISKPSAHRTVGFLQGLGMIDKQRYGGISLTDKGRETARRLGIQKENIRAAFCRRSTAFPWRMPAPPRYVDRRIARRSLGEHAEQNHAIAGFRRYRRGIRPIRPRFALLKLHKAQRCCGKAHTGYQTRFPQHWIGRSGGL